MAKKMSLSHRIGVVFSEEALSNLYRSLDLLDMEEGPSCNGEQQLKG
jgi:hypothetical protein